MNNLLDKKIKKAISEIKKGKGIIIVDDHDRENEGDLIFPGETMTKENMIMMLNHASGIVCLSVSPGHAEKLQLSHMVKPDKNNSGYKTPFAISIEAKSGITTGVSAADRTQTIRVASGVNSCVDDIVSPGHIFPLIANEHGVLGRQGHTEAGVDIVRMAGFNPAAVLCELTNNDGTMMKGEQIKSFADANDIMILAIKELRQYRLLNELFIEKKVTSKIPFDKYGYLDMSVYVDSVLKEEIVTLSCNLKVKNPVVRMHSSCLTGDLFGSLRCDCQSQLHHGLSLIKEQGGVLIYLNQEGRGIGLINKLKAYNLQINENLDTVEANLALDLPADSRVYDMAVQILKYEKITECRLISNNPEKITALENAGIIVNRVASSSEINDHNKSYLATKKNKLNHDIKGV